MIDHATLGHLIDAHARALELYARQWCDPAEDVVQEAFVALAAQRTLPDNPAAWLFRTVRHRAINAGKAARRRRTHETRAAHGWFENNAISQNLDTIDPDDATAALAALPTAQREVIIAHLWGGLTFAEIATVIATSTSSAHRLYQTGLETLKTRLEAAPSWPTSRT